MRVVWSPRSEMLNHPAMCVDGVLRRFSLLCHRRTSWCRSQSASLTASKETFSKEPRVVRKKGDTHEQAEGAALGGGVWDSRLRPAHHYVSVLLSIRPRFRV